MGIDFNKYAQEGYTFLHELTVKLGHEGEEAQTGILLRAVLHTLRDRIAIEESLNLLAQLPMFLKGLYVENWKFKPGTSRIERLKDFTEAVKKEQQKYGETKFNWEESTADLIKVVIKCLSKYISDGEMLDVLAQLPTEIRDLMEEAVKV